MGRFFRKQSLCPWLGFAVLAALIVAIYSNTLHVPFNFDDARNIDTANIRISDLKPATLFKAAFGGTLKSRPLANLSFALNYYFHKRSLPGYHLVNIAIHLINVLLLYIFLRITLGLAGAHQGRSYSRLLPFWGAMLWGVHPLATQSVTYIVQRMNLFAAMFFLLSLVAYAKGRLSEKWGWRGSFFVLSVVSAILAFASKENSFSLPAVLFLYEWFFFQDLSWPWLKRHAYLPTALLLLGGGLLFSFFGNNPLAALNRAYVLRPFSLGERLLTEPRVVFFYLGLLFFPEPGRLNLLHDFSLSQSLFSPFTTILSITTLVGLLLAAALLARRERLLSFAIFWFFLNLVIESSFVPLEIIYEHRTYIPSMLFFLFWGVLIYRFLSPKAALVFALVLTPIFSFWTYERNKVWQDGLTFWEDCVRKSPNLGRAHNNYAYYLYKIGKIGEAEREFERVLTLNPPGKVAGRAYYNLGVIMARRGRYREAIGQYSEALRLYPNNSEAQNNIGDIYNRVGNLKAAEYHLRRAVVLDPNDYYAQHNLGLVLARQHKYRQALRYLEAAVRLNPQNQEARKDLRVLKGLLARKP